MIARRHLYGGLAGALTAGVLGGGVWPPPPTPELSEVETPWTLLSVADLQRHVAQDHATAIRDLPWNAGDAIEQEEAHASLRWRLAGIVTEQQQPLILVLIPDQPGQIQRIQIGDPLPDDSVLEAVENDQVLIRHGECVTTWKLFHPQPIATSDACQQAEPHPQGTPS